MSLVVYAGRFGNRFIMAMCGSLIAEKFELKINYGDFSDEIKRLGVVLFSNGTKQYNKTTKIDEKNYIKILGSDAIESNLIFNDWFQTVKITALVFDKIKTDKGKIINANPFKERFENNNDVFIHYRLGDISDMGYDVNLEYYITAVKKIKSFDKIYISSDSPNDLKVKTLISQLNCIIVDYDTIKTLQFASTCKHLVLSHGSFSAVMGYLSFGENNVYYPDFDKSKKMWFGDMFTDKGWTKI